MRLLPDRSPVLIPLVLAFAAASVVASAPLARAAAPAAPAAAAPNPAPLGTFSNWTAATYDQAGQKICYTFTRPTNSTPVIAGRTEVLLSITERPGVRDEAALTAGFPYVKGANVTVSVGSTALSFYTAGDAAFARDGTAAVHAFKAGNTAIVHSPGPHGVSVADSFSLSGFTDAYDAIVKACPK
ncbi:MAG: invasion associated locus B family protein [Acetobacteraceae bacterium]